MTRHAPSIHRLLSVVLWGVVMWAVLPSAWAEPVKAVSFSFRDLDGRNVKLGDYRGKWVLVSFWAPWCPICKVQVPSLNALNQRPDFRVIGVALDYAGDESAVRQAVSGSRMQYEAVIAGGARKDQLGAHRQVGPVDFFPTSYLYDPTGEIVMFIPGQLRVGNVVAFMDAWRRERGTGSALAINADTARLASLMRQRFGAQGERAFADWKHALDAALEATPAQKLSRINDFFNQRIKHGEDMAIWGKADHWATPGELLGKGRGDSEDFALAKYFSLLALHVPEERLRLVYVRQLDRKAAQADAAHMVVAYYESNSSEPLILDSLERHITPATRRRDLQPVFSFNSLGAREELASAATGTEAGRLAVWEDALRRIRAEGFQ